MTIRGKFRPWRCEGNPRTGWGRTPQLRPRHSNLQPIVNLDSLHAQPTDPFSEVLQSWYLPDWQAGLAEFRAPWGIAVPQGLATFYVVLGGPCLLTCEEAKTRSQLNVGDVLLLPHGSAHRLQDQPDSPARSLAGGFDSGDSRGGSGLSLEPTTGLIYGCFSVGQHVFQPVTGGLPPVVRLKAESFDALRGCAAIAKMVVDQQAVAAPVGTRLSTNSFESCSFRRSVPSSSGMAMPATRRLTPRERRGSRPPWTKRSVLPWG